ncbi:hypothetical protein [Lysinibacter cavernae]|uniref:hypothetical protein n=1 Tax=Lysinibacter cavernae TaxID=1640652 RepID=UPI00361C8320
MLKTKARQLLAVEGSDVLVMPWHQISRISEGSASPQLYRDIQMRPSNPLAAEDSEGRSKVQKYDAFPGTQFAFDIHPSTPSEWLDTSTTYLMTEGLLKGDSALTAQLLDSGVDPKDLMLPEDSDTHLVTAIAHERLKTMMAAINPDKRVVIISISGVTMWNQNYEWAHVILRDRKLLVAFDGDVAENWDVWNQARRLTDFVTLSKSGTAKLLDLDSSRAVNLKVKSGFDREQKLGLDDFLSKVGDWQTALSFETETLPKEPPRKDEDILPVGTWRVHKSGNFVEELYKADDGLVKTKSWRQVEGVGARILNSKTRRRPAASEIESGTVDHDLDKSLASTTCEIEVQWLTETGEQKKGVIVGPSTNLATAPDRWQKSETHYPAELLYSPEWPPKDGLKWLRAIKANLVDQRVDQMKWDTMGWVPGEHEPSFLIGSQVLARTLFEESNIITGVNESEIGGATKFGVIDNYRKYVDPEGNGEVDSRGLEEYKAEVLKDIELLVDGFVEGGFWLQKEYGVILLATMLRPTLPVRTGLSVYCYGPPRVGKSWAAGFIMSAWQRVPGTWHENSLPGSANDTLFAVEQAVSKVPIWVADDLAPSMDSRQTITQEAMIGNLIRSIHSGAGKRRGRSDGELREQSSPKALFIATGENDLSVPSIRQRTIMLSFGEGVITPDDKKVQAMRWLTSENGAPARVAAAMIRFWHQTHISSDGRQLTAWSDRVLHLKQMLKDHVDLVQEQLDTEHDLPRNTTARQAGSTAELSVTLAYLSALYEWAGGVKGSAVDVTLYGGDRGVQASALGLLVKHAAKSINSHKGRTPDVLLLASLRDLLESGSAHVAGPLPGLPPFFGEGKDKFNESLGWRLEPGRDTWVPRGTQIGAAGLSSTSGLRIVVFNVSSAFNEVARRFPERILPGQKAQTSWSTVWSAGHCDGHPPKDGVSVRPRVKIESDGTSTQYRGVPVRLDSFLSV